MKTVTIFGLTDYDNVGDQALAICTKFLVDQIGGYETRIFSQSPTYKKYHPRYIVFAFMLILSKLFKGWKSTLSDKLFINAYRYRFQNKINKAITGSDAIIIGCGAIKYSNQNLDVSYETIIDIANENNIPVMLSAMTVEPYNKASYRCRLLKESLCKESVKMITTRDGYLGVKRLVENYGVSKSSAYDVGDVVFWLNDIFKVDENKKEIIGIGLIRPDIFKDYNGQMSELELVEFYKKLLLFLENNSYPYKLFTNGLKEDQRFGEDLIRTLGLPQERLSYRPRNSQELVNILSEFKVVFCARMHACIFSYALDIPFVGFYWDHKLENFAKTTANESRFLQGKDLDVDKVIEKLEYSMSNPYDSDIRNKLKSKTKESIGNYLGNINQTQTKKKKVLVVTGGNLGRGGVQRFLERIFSDMQADCEFIWYIPGEILEEEKDYKEFFENLHVNIVLGNNLKKSFFPKVLGIKRDISSIIDRYDIDVIHINTGSLFIAYTALKVAVKNNIETRLVHSHNTGRENGIKKLAFTQIRKYIRKYATSCIGCSDEAGKWLFGNDILEDKKWRYIKNPIDINKYRFKGDARSKIRSQYRISDDKILVGFVGRITHRKNPMLLIEILKELEGSNIDAALLIVGDGDLKQNFLEKAKDILKNPQNVIVTGVVSNVQDYMEAIDVFVLPSFNEGFPITSVEAQASGCVCFLSDRISRQTNITDEVEYFSIDSAKPWAKGICRLKENSRLTDLNYRKNAYRIVYEKGFSNAYLKSEIEREYNIKTNE